MDVLGTANSPHELPQQRSKPTGHPGLEYDTFCLRSEVYQSPVPQTTVLYLWQ